MYILCVWTDTKSQRRSWLTCTFSIYVQSTVYFEGVIKTCCVMLVEQCTCIYILYANLYVHVHVYLLFMYIIGEQERANLAVSRCLEERFPTARKRSRPAEPYHRRSALIIGPRPLHDHQRGSERAVARY